MSRSNRDRKSDEKRMISFYPGPSRVHDDIPRYVQDAFNKGMLSINHRSDEFMEMSERTLTLLKEKLEIPRDYTIFYTSSATECWEIIAQSVIETQSYHLFNGAFGKKWFEYTRRLHPEATPLEFGLNDLIDVEGLQIEAGGVLCLTQNETSNGTQVSAGTMASLREKYPDNLIAVDATSSMAGIRLDFTLADIWFASVQKCFGLPAGLGLLICSPTAMEHVTRVDEKDHYNSLTFMASMMEKWQTPFTPNVLNIYLLCRVMEKAKPIAQVHEKILGRYKKWSRFFSEKITLHPLVDNEQARSYTVIPVAADETLIASVKSKARKKGFLLGEGYGDLKTTTFRVANFPAIRKKEIKALKDFFSDYD